MTEDITKKQRILCEKCPYRDRTLDKIVFCPYVYNCRRKPTFRYPKGHEIEKGGNEK
jgi:hypothetical protein